MIRPNVGKFCNSIAKIVFFSVVVTLMWSFFNYLDTEEISLETGWIDTWSVVQLMAFLQSDRMMDRSACQLSRDFGGFVYNKKGHKDGNKFVCLDDRFKPATNNCLVYSFGIDNEWSFDEAMANQFGCDVYSFDPSMEENDHDHAEKIHFYQTGLWKDDGYLMLDARVPDVVWKVSTLTSLYRQLQHHHRFIDYLKIDIEGDEWNVLPHIMNSSMLQRVKQLGMEIHFNGNDHIDDIRRKVQMLYSLKNDHQLIPFKYENNLVSKGNLPQAPEAYGCAEIVYLNRKFLQRHDDDE